MIHHEGTKNTKKNNNYSLAIMGIMAMKNIHHKDTKKYLINYKAFWDQQKITLRNFTSHL